MPALTGLAAPIAVLAGAGLAGAGLVLGNQGLMAGAGVCLVLGAAGAAFGLVARALQDAGELAPLPALRSKAESAPSSATDILDMRLGRAARLMGLGITMYDAEDRLRMVDDDSAAVISSLGGRAVLGRSVEEIARMSATSGTIRSAIGREEDWVAERLHVHRVPGAALDFELMDGTWLRLVNFRDQDGWTIGIRSDITELRRREEAAAARQEAEIRLNDAVETIEVNLMLFDAGGHLLLANSAAKECYAELGDVFAPGMSFHDWLEALLHLDLAGEAMGRERAWANDLDWAFTQGDGSRMERRLGDRRFEFHAHRARDGSVLVVENDLTEALQREEALERQTALLRTTLDNTAQAIAVYDAEQRLMAWNRRFVELFQLPDTLARPGAPLTEILKWCSEAGVLELPDPEAFLAGRRPEFANPTGAASILPMAGERVVEVRLHAAGEGRVVATLTDLTGERRRAGEIERAKEAAELANRAKSQFLANMTHELRTPLNAIIGFAEVLRDELFGPLGASQYREFVVDIHDSGTHLLSLINDILDFAKTESGQRLLSVQPFDLDGASGAALRMVQARAAEKEIMLRTAFPEESLVVMGEERAFRQILLNLLSNAIKFTPRGGIVTVAADRRNDGGLILTVSDTGIGIAPEDIPRALAPFVQVDSELSREFEGTGLGLPLAKNLVLLHGGELTLDSAVGTGTTVRIELPPDRLVDSGSAQNPAR